MQERKIKHFGSVCTMVTLQPNWVGTVSLAFQLKHPVVIGCFVCFLADKLNIHHQIINQRPSILLDAVDPYWNFITLFILLKIYIHLILIIYRYAWKKEYNNIRLLSRAVCRRNIHHYDPETDTLLFLQSYCALCFNIIYGSAGVHTASRLRGKVDAWFVPFVIFLKLMLNLYNVLPSCFLRFVGIFLFYNVLKEE